MLSQDEEVSVQSAVKLVRMIVEQTDLPWNKKAEADEALRRLMGVVCGASELPETTPDHRRRHSAA